MSRFILASSSPRRQELIASLGIRFEIIKPEIDEHKQDNESPLDYVQRLSREKAQAVAQQLATPATILAADTTVVLAADTIGVLQDRPIEEFEVQALVDAPILEKPLDADDARQMLKRLRQSPHFVITGYTILRLGEAPIEITDFSLTRVTMRPYTDAEIKAYIASGDPFDKAGAYAIQNPDFKPVAKIDGDYNNVVGLPLAAVKESLLQIGYLKP